jgi:hypothetical protein
VASRHAAVVDAECAYESAELAEQHSAVSVNRDPMPLDKPTLDQLGDDASLASAG